MSIYKDYWTKPAQESEDEEMIDLSIPDGYNEYMYEQVVLAWRNGSPMSE